MNRAVYIAALWGGLVAVTAFAAQDGGAAEVDGGVPADVAAEVEAPPRLGWLEVVQAGPSVTNMALQAAREELSGLPVTWLAAPELLEALRQRDREQGLLGEAGSHLQQGRKLHLGLKLDQAQAEYRQAVQILERGFTRHYAPSQLAEPLLQLGVAQFQAGDKAAASKTFMRVAALAPHLSLAQGYYSPSVRKAYAEAVAGLGPREVGLPNPEELARICRALELSGLVTAASERLGDRPLLRLGLFDAKAGAFAALETAVLADDQSAVTGRDLAGRLTPAIVASLGLELPEPAVDAGVDAGMVASVDEPLPVPDAGLAMADVEPADEGPHWAVEHWWIWPVAAGVVAASLAVALPLTVFREDVVDVRVRY